MELNIRTHGNAYSMPEVADIGKAVGLTKEESISVAKHLDQQGWVRFTPVASPGGGHVSITMPGIQEVERLMQPTWKRYLTDQTVIIAIISAILSSIITALIAKWL
jgi:hypothetical protein